MPEHDLRLLSLDGGGVRGLSTLQIVKQLMDIIDPELPPKPCDYFDIIGGTSTGGLIAIMLGRLRMTVDECIDVYVSLSDRIFQKQRHRVTIKGRVQGRFDSDELERAIKEIVARQEVTEDALLKDAPDAKCKVFVCATSSETGDTVRLTSYRSPRGRERLLHTTKIWEAGRATLAASSFFDPITIGDFEESFVDGATGANNPVYEVWNEAQDIWPSGSLEDNIKCLVSIGTGVPSLTPFTDDPIGIAKSLLEIATETERTAERFSRDKSQLDDTGRYYRFNVLSGLDGIGLEDSKRKNAIIAATDRYIESQVAFKKMKACANNLAYRMDTDESQLTTLDRECLDAYYQQARECISFPRMMAPADIEDDVGWITATSLYRSWITDPKPNMPGQSRIIWCQTADDTDRGYPFGSLFRLKGMSALFINCRDVPFSPSKSASDISTTAAGSAETPKDCGLVALPIHEGPSDIGLGEQDVTQSAAGRHEDGTGKSNQAPRSDKVRGIIWGLLVQIFMSVSPVTAIESFGLYVLSSMPPENKRSRGELANLTALLCNSLATWTVKTVIILDYLDHLDYHELVQLDRAISQLLQHSAQVRFMLLSEVIKPGPLRDNALLVDQDTAYRECSNTFYVKNMMRRRDHIATASVDTNHWVWSNPSYRAWATDSSLSALWIAGKPGSGKSVLARTIEEDLTGKGGFKTAIVATWFYSVRDNLIHHSEMLSGLLFQMLRREKRVFQRISKRYCKKRENAREIQWSFTELKGIFAEIVGEQSLDKPLFLVLDGIDESSLKGAEGECSRAMLLQFFLDILRSCPTGRVKVIFLSRLEEDIRSVLRKLPSIIMHQVNSKDIEKVVDVGIESILDELRLLEGSGSDNDDMSMTLIAEGRGSFLFEQAEKAQSELIQHIRRYLIENADGVILWVSSVISHIHMQLDCAFCTLSQLAAEIEKLPTELSEVYFTIVRSIAKAPEHSSTLALAQRALLWVRSNPALGKFYAQDLLEVLAIDQDRAGDRWATVTGWSSFHKQLTRLCGPFLEIVTKELGWNCGRYDPVQLLHHTVKVFLDDPQASAPLYLSSEESAKRFESDCMRYMQKTLPETPSLSDPLRAGAAADLDRMIHDITTYLEDRPLLSFILTFNPNMASFLPVRYKEILQTFIMLPPSVGGLGVDSVRKLFYQVCKNGRANAICALFAISSRWLNTWEWYLIEPEIIKGTIQAARELSIQKELKCLYGYALCRGILRGFVDEHDLRYRSLEFASPGVKTIPDLTSPEIEPKSISMKSTKTVQGPLDVARAINEVLVFWIQLAGSPELQTSEAFRGAKEPHLSECLAIACRMAIIRASVLDSKRPSVMAEGGGGWPKMGDGWESVTGGLRVATAEPKSIASYAPFRESPFSDALSRIEEAPNGDGPAPLSSFVWQENLRFVIGKGSDTYEENGSKHDHFFNELPPILPSVFPRDHCPIAEEFAQTSSRLGSKDDHFFNELSLFLRSVFLRDPDPIAEEFVQTERRSSFGEVEMTKVEESGDDGSDDVSIHLYDFMQRSSKRKMEENLEAEKVFNEEDLLWF